ncbi:MAG: hypothetical protein AAFV53_05145 [Myxococcota bacterium]
MESDDYYDIRGPEQASGVFDLRSHPKTLREGLIQAVRRRLSQPLPVILDAQGFAYCEEPDSGPNPHWTQQVFALQQQMEIALSQRVPMITRVERVYTINFAVFQPTDWETLAALFGQMPGWVAARPLPHWYGEPKASPPFIVARIEKQGLRVRALITTHEWLGWDTFLRKNLHRVPTRPAGFT